MIDILWYIVLGVVVGILARLIHPGRERMGWIVTLLIGIAGCFVAGLVSHFLESWDTISWQGFAVAIVVAVVLVTIYAGLTGTKKK